MKKRLGAKNLKGKRKSVWANVRNRGSASDRPSEHTRPVLGKIRAGPQSGCIAGWVRLGEALDFVGDSGGGAAVTGCKGELGRESLGGVWKRRARGGEDRGRW